MSEDSIRYWDKKDAKNVDMATENLADGRTVMQNQSGIKAEVIDVTPVLDTSAFAVGDVMSDTFEIPGAVDIEAGTSLLHSLMILDKDAQGGIFDLVIMRTNKSLGTKNAAVSISDADATEILGVISIVAEDYVDLVGSKIVAKTLVGLSVEAGASSTSIYGSLVSRDTKTYTASGLLLKFGFAKD